MIYFIQGQESGNIKIGYSITPDKRLNNLQTAHYEDLNVIGLLHGSMKDEEKLHKMFEDYHLRGEWYSPGDLLLEYINKNSQLKNSVIKLNDKFYKILLVKPIKLTLDFYVNISSFNLKILADSDLRFVFGVEGKREIILDWLKDIDGLTSSALAEFESNMI